MPVWEVATNERSRSVSLTGLPDTVALVASVLP